jgi:hypothetical protein
MRTPPTEEEIAAEIKALTDLKPKIRPTSAFGESNTAAISAQIEVLKNLWDVCEVEDHYDGNDYALGSATEAAEWLEGESESATLTENWRGLIVK